MNVRSSLCLRLVLASVVPCAALAACGDPASPSSGAASGGAGAVTPVLATPDPAATPASSTVPASAPASAPEAREQLSAPDAVGACVVGPTGSPRNSPDLCAGSGASRIVVTYGAGSTCSDALGIPIGGRSSSGVVKSYLFADAPPEVRERFCVFDSAAQASTSLDADAERAVGGFCASPGVVAVTRDCGGGVKAQASAPAARGTASAPSLVAGSDVVAHTGPANERTPASCDVCAMVASGALYVNVPADFVAPQPNTPTVVRFAAPSVSDLVVYPPVLTQSFVVSGVTAPTDSGVTIYAPGVVPDPKTL